MDAKPEDQPVSLTKSSSGNFHIPNRKNSEDKDPINGGGIKKNTVKMAEDSESGSQERLVLNEKQGNNMDTLSPLLKKELSIRKESSLSANMLKSTKQNKIAPIYYTISVGKIQDGQAILIGEDYSLIEVPLKFLPADIKKGNILKFKIERNYYEEERRRFEITDLQSQLLEIPNFLDQEIKK